MYCEMYNQVNNVKYVHTPLFGNSALRKHDPHELWRRVLLLVYCGGLYYELWKNNMYTHR